MIYLPIVVACIATTLSNVRNVRRRTVRVQLGGHLCVSTRRRHIGDILETVGRRLLSFCLVTSCAMANYCARLLPTIGCPAAVSRSELRCRVQ